MRKIILSVFLASIALAGCTTTGPIVAGAVDQVGIAVSGGAQDQGANMTLGYRGAKFAVVPVQTANGAILALEDGPNKEKGFSVFALLGIDRTTAGVAGGIGGVEQVVAVGNAADIYADARGQVLTRTGTPVR